MKMIRSLLVGIASVAVIATAAWAVQLGTSGTNKQNQQSGFRVGVLECFNTSATASGGAATINSSGLNPSACGTVTSESLTTAAGSDYTLTLTNNLVAATDIVLGSVQNGTNTQGAVTLRSITPAAGSVVFRVRNGQSSLDSALSGTIKISFFIIKQGAHGSD